MRVAIAAVVAALVAAAAWWLIAGRADPRDAVTAVASDYLDAWGAGDTDRMRALATGPTDGLPDAVERFDGALAVAARSHRIEEVVLHDGGRATVTATAQLVLSGLGEWNHELTLPVVEDGGGWAMEWDASTLHPQLDADTELARTRSWPERAPVLGHDGERLAGPVEVVVVSLHGERIEDPEAVVTALVSHTPADEEAARAALERAQERPTWQVPVVPMRRDDFEAVRPELFPVPGVVFPTEQRHLQVEPDLAEHVIGTVGPITEELLADLGEPYVATDRVGRSGLERAYERQLAGRPSGEVRIVDEAGEVVEVLHRFPGEEPAPLHTTLDLDIQRAAETAVSGVDGPAAVVVVDAATGAIRAAVSRPISGPGRALTGRYPPGSTFKVVTTAALLAAGIGPEDTVPCPAQVTVGGKAFRNAHDLAAGDIPFAVAFEESCNTAFVQLAADLPGGTLDDAASSFGFGADYPGFPLPVAGGSFPRPGSAVDQAAAAIGQGQVLASPLHNATIAAAVRSGTWRSPVLVRASDEGPEASPTPSERPITDPSTIAALMRRVVASGTGTAADVGDDVHGKTGTAEFGEGDPPPTHAWFIGFRRDLAFAVLVEGGGEGGAVAAPIAAELLRSVD